MDWDASCPFTQQRKFMKSQTLAELGDLRTGYSARKKMDAPSEFATHWIVPFRALSKETKTIDWSALDPIAFQLDDARYLLKEGDVLISMRGHFVAVRADRLPKKILVHHNWAVLTPGPNLDGGFFAWWFNHPQTQKSLMRQQLGSAQIFMPFSDLKQLNVPLPSLEKQAMFAYLDQLWRREQELLRQLQVKREHFFQSLTLKLITEEN